MQWPPHDTFIAPESFIFLWLSIIIKLYEVALIVVSNELDQKIDSFVRGRTGASFALTGAGDCPTATEGVHALDQCIA